MKPPPDQVAAIVEPPLNRSSAAIRLVPALLGLPWVAYQEIIDWVTSWGWNEPPLMPQSVRGAFALETSASTGLEPPWSWSTASWAAGVPTQLECRAAHAGTAIGLGSGIGVGVGLGLSGG